MFKKMAVAAVGAAVLVIPAAVSAQQYYGSGQVKPYYAQYYGQPRGDYDSRWRGRFSGYPEFRGVEQHIRQEIQSGVREDLIAPDDARDLMGQLRTIQNQEAREYRVHGWNLPDDDRYRLRSQLQQLDQLVDQIRDES